MCLILHKKDKVIRTAKEDLITYKFLNQLNRFKAISKYRNYEYTMMQHNPMVKISLNDKNDFCFWGDYDEEYFSVKYRHILNQQDNKLLYQMHYGYHSFIDIVDKIVYDKMKDTYDTKLYECVIPKGTKYVINELGLVISETIIVKYPVSDILC